MNAAPHSRLNYKQALAWLYGLQRFGIKLGLENIRRLIADLSRSGAFQAVVGDLEVALTHQLLPVAAIAAG